MSLKAGISTSNGQLSSEVAWSHPKGVLPASHEGTLRGQLRNRLRSGESTQGVSAYTRVRSQAVTGPDCQHSL